MKNIFLITLLFFTMGCKKDKDTWSNIVLISETGQSTDSNVVLRGVIMSHPMDLKLNEHGFIVILDQFNNLYDTIKLGPKNSAGVFEHTYSNFTGSYEFYTYVIDEQNHRMQSHPQMATITSKP